MKLSDLDKEIKLIVEAGFPFAKKDDDKEDKKDEKDTDKKENPFAKKEDGKDTEDKESDKESDNDEEDDDEDEKSESQPESKPASAPTDSMPKAETPKATELKPTDAQPIASVNTELTGKEQQYLQPNPPLAPNAVKGEQPADAVAQLGSNQSALAKELGNFVETAKALKGVLDVLKDFAQPTVVQPAPAAPAPTAAPAPASPASELSPELKQMDDEIMAKVKGMSAQDTAQQNQEQQEEPVADETAQEPEVGVEEPVADETGDVQADETATDPAQDAQKGLTDEIKAAFKIKPGTKKYDPATHQVYWKVGDVLMSAPADNPEQETEVTDEDTIASVGL